MSRHQDDPIPKRPSWYWWALVNLLALCFAVISWTLAMEIFGRPDVPSNYEMLRKIDRAPKFKVFSPQGAPEGRSFDPSDAYAWFFELGDEGYSKLNRLYRRNYMRNFDDAHAVTYVEGTFEVLATRRLGEEDFIPEGLAIRAQALVRADDFSPEAPYPVIIELILPLISEGVSIAEGERISFTKSPHLPVVMHVGRYMERDEPTVQVTLIPIGSGVFQFGDRKSFDALPAGFVNPEGRLRHFEAQD